MSKLDLELRREVNRAPGDVWSFVAEDFFANHSKWDPAIVEMRKLTEGKVSEGTRGVEVRRFGGKQKAEFVVYEFRPTERFAFRNTTGPFELDRAYSFHSMAGHLEMKFHFTMTPKGMMKLFFPILRGLVAKQVEINIDRLRDLLNAAR